MGSLIFITLDIIFFSIKWICSKSYVIKIRESIDILAILHFYEKSTSGWYEGWSQLSFETFLEILQTAEILEKNGLTCPDFWRRTYVVYNQSCQSFWLISNRSFSVVLGRKLQLNKARKLFHTSSLYCQFCIFDNFLTALTTLSALSWN